MTTNSLPPSGGTPAVRPSPMKGRTKTRALGPELMPLKLAVEVFGFGLRTFRTWATAQQITLRTIGGASYVDLPSLAVKLGEGTYAHLMQPYQYDRVQGWTQCT